MSDAPHRHQRNLLSRLRLHVYRALGGSGPRPGFEKVIEGLLVGLICINALVSIFETVEEFDFLHGPFFLVFDVVSVLIFTAEYGLRIWTAVEMEDPRFHHPIYGRLRYMISPLALIDLVAILPFYLGILFEFDLRAVRVFRLLRVLKLTRYSQAMTIMLAVLRQEARAMGAVLFVFLIILVSVASLMYLLEHEAQPTHFANIPDAMWWAVVTMTTVGYGDITPITPLGRLLGAFTALMGVGMIALPAGVLASGFSEQMRQRRAEYREKLEGVVHNGKVSDTGRRRIEELRRELGLSAEEANFIRERMVHRALLHCPHCGEALVEAEGEE